MTDYQRYAVYYAPHPQSDLGRFGNAWLGRDPLANIELARPALAGLKVNDVIAATTSPTRYGFHGTLKPPFTLKQGQSRSGLEAALEKLCADITPVTCGPLTLKSISGFLALIPTDPVAPLEHLAARMVRDLDDFRQPEDATAMNKRRAAGLSARQENYLVTWGYPYVMEDFRFHLTLSNKLAPKQLERFEASLASTAAPLCQTAFIIDDICLFGDPGDGKPFHLLRRFALNRSKMRQ
jgi:putative phosphonate metabolism protein